RSIVRKLELDVESRGDVGEVGEELCGLNTVALDPERDGVVDRAAELERARLMCHRATQLKRGRWASKRDFTAKASLKEFLRDESERGEEFEGEIKNTSAEFKVLVTAHLARMEFERDQAAGLIANLEFDLASQRAIAAHDGAPRVNRERGFERSGDNSPNG